MALGGFFSGGGSDQRSDSYTGLRNLGGNNNMATDMGNLILGGVKTGLPSAQSMFVSPESYLTNGLYGSQNALLPNLVSMAGNKMSAAAGARGFLSPENVSSIAGSAAQNLAPFLMPLMSSNINDIRSSGANVFANLLSTGTNALGSETHSTGEQRNPGIGFNFLNSFGTSLGSSFGKSLGSGAGGAAGGAMFG